jgi:hypothetical protein
MEDQQKLYGQCPKCKKGYLVRETLYEGVILNRQKVAIFFCPFCDFKNIHKFKLNEQQYKKETK